MSKRWSYQVIELKPSWSGTIKSQAVQEELNRQGAQGWELVSARQVSAFMPYVLVFKKEH